MANDPNPAGAGGTGGTQDKTFTQEQLDAIVKDRLAREREKYADYEDVKAKADKFDEAQEASKSELQKAQDKAAALQTELEGLKRANGVKAIRDKVSADTGVPASLLSGDTEDACKAQADAIIKFAGGKSKYPNIGEDGGEDNPGKKLTKEDILKIKDERKRIKAIEENIDLFT